jgi:hypothetical protein
MKPDIEESTYPVQYARVTGTFTYIMKGIGAEVRGHGEKAP